MRFRCLRLFWMLTVRVIGLVRVMVKVGLKNLDYNFDRYCMFVGR